MMQTPIFPSGRRGPRPPAASARLIPARSASSNPGIAA
jgi:hypothetical protein